MDTWNRPLPTAPFLKFYNVFCVLLRFSKKNLILWGLWQGRKEPVMSTFLMPFLLTVVDLREKGKFIKICFS